LLAAVFAVNKRHGSLCPGHNNAVSDGLDGLVDFISEDAVEKCVCLQLESGDDIIW